MTAAADVDLCVCVQLTIDIGTEVKYQNKMLGEMVSWWSETWRSSPFCGEDFRGSALCEIPNRLRHFGSK